MSEIIVIDPRHGGLDPGAVNGSYQEKPFNWKIANVVKDGLKNHDCTTYIVQPSTEFKSTSRDELIVPVQRAKLLKATYYLSIHQNSGGGKGFESYVASVEKWTRSDVKRKILHSQIMEFLRPYEIIDRGFKHNNFYMLANSESEICDSCLLECLFMNNSRELDLLMNKDFVLGLGNEIACGLVLALGL